MGAAPQAAGRIHLVADQGIGTAVRIHSWRLVGQVLGGIDHLILQRHFVPGEFTILDLVHVPGSIRHTHLLTAPSVRDVGAGCQ